MEILVFTNIQAISTLNWGSGETFQFNILLEVEMLVFTNIQAISTLVCVQLDDNGQKSKWTNGSILTKVIGTYKSEMPGNSAGNYVTLHEFQSSHL